MPPFCYLLIEGVVFGCTMRTTYVGVTFNQTEAYTWSTASDDPSIRRQAVQVPFLNT